MTTKRISEMTKFTLVGERRIAADKLWRDPVARRRFEKEYGMVDALPGTAEYEGAFLVWAAKELDKRC